MLLCCFLVAFMSDSLTLGRNSCPNFIEENRDAKKIRRSLIGCLDAVFRKVIIAVVVIVAVLIVMCSHCYWRHCHRE